MSLPPRPSIRFAASLLTMMSSKPEPMAFSIDSNASVKTPSVAAPPARLISWPRAERS